MKKFKLSLLTFMFFSVTMFVGLSSLVEAAVNNHGDSPWSFTLGANQANSYTPYREKRDPSYLYIAVKANKPDVRAWGQGTGGTEHGSPKTYCGIGKSAFIPSNIHEDGKRSARLVIEAPYKNPQRISTEGFWSPDSVKADGTPFI